MHKEFQNFELGIKRAVHERAVVERVVHGDSTPKKTPHTSQVQPNNAGIFVFLKTSNEYTKLINRQASSKHKFLNKSNLFKKHLS